MDYLVQGRFHLIPRHPPLLGPENLKALTAQPEDAQNPGSAGAQAPGAATGSPAETQAAESAHSGLREIKATNE